MSPNKQPARLLPFGLLAAAGLLLLAGCAQKMASQGRYKPLEADEFFSDDRSARTMISGTLPIEALPANDPFGTGRANGQFVATVPMTVTDALLLRGRTELNIYCAPCHGGGLTGNGTVVQKGFPPPPNLLDGHPTTMTVGELFNVVTHGQGVMPRYADQIRPADRWAAVAALRSLQQQVRPQPTATAKP